MQEELPPGLSPPSHGALCRFCQGDPGGLLPGPAGSLPSKEYLALALCRDVLGQAWPSACLGCQVANPGSSRRHSEENGFLSFTETHYCMCCSPGVFLQSDRMSL